MQYLQKLVEHDHANKVPDPFPTLATGVTALAAIAASPPALAAATSPKATIAAAVAATTVATAVAVGAAAVDGTANATTNATANATANETAVATTANETQAAPARAQPSEMIVAPQLHLPASWVAGVDALGGDDFNSVFNHCCQILIPSTMGGQAGVAGATDFECCPLILSALSPQLCCSVAILKY